MNTSELMRCVICSNTLILSLALVAFAIVGSLAYSNKNANAGASFGRIFEMGNFMRICVAVLVVMAVVQLSLARLLVPEATASILSGVAGYALGGLVRGEPSQKDGTTEKKDSSTEKESNAAASE